MGDGLTRLSSPQDLTSFRHQGQWLVANPALATFVSFDNDEYAQFLAIVANIGLQTPVMSDVLAKAILHRIVYPTGVAPEVKERPTRLRQVYYAITEGCNLRCPYCYMSAERPRPGELTTAEAMDVVDQAVGLGAEKIFFTGGEPLLRRDVLDVASYAKERGLATGMISNGTPIKSLAKASAIADAIDTVTISIDGGVEEINDRTRGKGAFKATRRALELLNAAGVRPLINHVVSDQNAEYLPLLADLLSGFHVSRVKLMHHSPLGRGLTDGADVDWHTYKAICAFTWSTPKGQSMSREGPQEARNGAIQKNCGLGGNEIYITSVGDVFPCKLVTNPAFNAGNLRSQPLTKIFESPVLSRLQQMTVYERNGCSTCYVRGSCGGGCRAHHQGFSGDLHKNAPSFCRMLRNMNVTNMWQANGVKPSEFTDGPDDEAFTPRSVVADAASILAAR